METTEKIVEAYVRYVKGWFTIPNIKCAGQLEIDLLAIDARNGRKLERYHIESGVSISRGFSRLTGKPYSAKDLKERLKTPHQRRTLSYFTERKFDDPCVIKTVQSFGFVPGEYARVVVSWGWEPDLLEKARALGVELWDFRTLLKDIAAQACAGRRYFTDDTMRTLQLMALAA
jgi:hypothetical protein